MLEPLFIPKDPKSFIVLWISGIGLLRDVFDLFINGLIIVLMPLPITTEDFEVFIMDENKL